MLVVMDKLLSCHVVMIGLIDNDHKRSWVVSAIIASWYLIDIQYGPKFRSTLKVKKHDGEGAADVPGLRGVVYTRSIDWTLYNTTRIKDAW